MARPANTYRAAIRNAARKEKIILCDMARYKRTGAPIYYGNTPEPPRIKSRLGAAAMAFLTAFGLRP